VPLTPMLISLPPGALGEQPEPMHLLDWSAHQHHFQRDTWNQRQVWLPMRSRVRRVRCLIG